MYRGPVLTEVSSKSGNYADQIAQNLYDRGLDNISDGHDYLFYCIGNGHGLINPREYCGSNSCKDGGSGKDDYCS